MAVAKSISRPRAFEPDERQREAIEHVHGPVLVIAGAGTGKTTVLTRRIAHLVREGHARPDEILAVTYTKNAAEEMRQRVQEELRGTSLTGLRISTFHEYCNELLIQNDRKFGVLDDQDLWIYLRRRIRELNLNYYVRAASAQQVFRRPACLLPALSRRTGHSGTIRRVCSEAGARRVARSAGDQIKRCGVLSDEEVVGRCREIAGVFTTVERMLREDNLGTFSHMITNAYQLLQQDSELARRAGARFILVDEFQDVNFAQVKVLQKVAGRNATSSPSAILTRPIYRFRGASSAAFVLFQRHFPGAKLIKLEKNRRSLSPILQ